MSLSKEMVNAVPVPVDSALVASSERGALLVAERPRLEALARRLLWDGEDARDVVQGAFVDAVSKWHTVRDEARRGAWLRQLVVNRAFSALRQRRVWGVVAKLLWLEPELAPSVDESADQRVHRVRLAEALERLPARQRLAFTLRYLEALELEEVAEAMAIDRGTVRVHVQRAVKALRRSGVLGEVTDD